MFSVKLTKIFFIICCLIFFSCRVFCGLYTEPGINKDDVSIISWAVHCDIVRGYVNITDPCQGYVSFGEPSNATGKAEGTSGDVVSLGDAGIATLTFDSSIYITNGAGYDFAVFENGFSVGSKAFLELGFVEVSSDGVNFFGFDVVSLSPTNIFQDGIMRPLDATNIHNLAGKHLRGYGTGFDLEELKDVNELLDVNSITHVRIIDVVGYVDRADLYGDGIVDFVDFSIFAVAYGSQADDDNWNEDCDIYQEWIPETKTEPGHYDDPDGKIDMKDLQVFIGNWLGENDYSSCDINAHQIYDPWPTPFDTGGFDLDAVGIINARERE